MPTSKAITASKFFGKDRYEYYLNELLTEQSLGGQKLSKEQLKEGFSKRKNKISFEKFVDSVVSTGSAKAAVSSGPSVGPVAPGGGGLGPKGGALVRSPGGALKNIIEGVSKTSQVGGIESDISIITKTVVSIADILSKQKKFNEDAAAYEKRKAEQDKRALAESKLEKRFEGLKKAAEKVLAPVKSILDKIINFLVTVFLGRVVFKLIEWFGDPKNAEKVKTIIRFLGDQWPKLLSLYLVFGTSFGRFAKGLLKVVARSGIKLLGLIAKLAAAKKIRGAGKVARFLGGGKGKLLGNVIGTAAALGGTYALTQGLSGGDDNKEPKAQGFSGGGYVTPKFPAFAGGGFNFKGMLGGASLGAMFGPLGMLLGGAFGGSNGFVSGEKGVDKVPAMLSDGEFVMSRGAVAKYGVDTLEAMNAAGGGTNKPKIMSGTTYAQGGGPIGNIPYFSPAEASDASMRKFADRFSSTLKIPADDIYKSFKTNGFPKFERILGTKDYYSFWGGGLDDDIPGSKEILDKIRGVIKGPQSFTQSSRAAAGLDDLAKKFDTDARTAPRYGENLPRLGRPKPTSTLKPKIPTLASELSPSYFLRGQSSLLPENYFLKGQSSLLPQPKPQASAFNRYRPGATIRATGPGMERFAELQRFTSVEGALSRTPKGSRGGGGRMSGPLAALFAALDFVGRKQEGQTNAQAALGAAGGAAGGQLGFMAGAKAGALLGGAIGAMFGGVGAGPGAIVGGIIGGIAGGFGGASLGGKLADDLSGVNALKERMSRGGIGGSIKGGYGLKNQSFKDMPKTQIMTDDKGRPFVGYKAMRGGKPVYVRGPQPGTGTTNPFEMLGRMINPGAYKENDQRLAMQKQKVAMVNSLESLQARGASIETQKRMMKQIGGNLKDVQNDLNYRKKQQAQISKTKPSNRRGAAPSSIRPPVKPAPKVVYGPPVLSSRQKNRRGGSATRTPNFSATSPASSAAKLRTLGVVGR